MRHTDKCEMIILYGFVSVCHEILEGGGAGFICHTFRMEDNIRMILIDNNLFSEHCITSSTRPRGK